MATLQLNNCSNESEIGQLAQAVLDEATRLRDEFLSQIAAIDPTDASADIDTGNSIYDGGIAPANNTDIATQVGLQTANPTVLEEESRLEPLGLVLVRGILYGSSTTNNIQNFRKLFFALGSNVSRFLEVVRLGEPVVVVQTRLVIRNLPASQAQWTVQQARVALSNDAIEAVYQTADGTFYCVVPQYLGYNKSKEQVSQEFSIPLAEITTQVFWFRTVSTQAHLLNRLVDYGITNNELSSVLTEQSLVQTRPSVVETLRAEHEANVRRTLEQIEFLNSRWSQYTPNDIQGFRLEIQTSLQACRLSVLAIQAAVRFSPTLIARPEDIDSFLELNVPEDLPYLFADKRTVLGIDFTIDRNDLLERVRNASNIPAGSNTVSSVLSNQVSSVDQNIDVTNKAWASVACGEKQTNKNGELRWVDLNIAYQCLGAGSVRPTVITVTTVPVIGYASFDAPASIMFRHADLAVSFKIDNLFDKIIALAEPISDVVAGAVRVFVELLRSLRRGIDAILNPLLDKVRKLTAQIEAFLSRHLSYFGTVSLDSSILKCALGLDLRVDTPFIRDLEPFLETLKLKLKAILSQISAIVSEYLNKFACLAPNFLNDLLKGPKSFLPAICRVDSFRLPVDLEAALFELQQFYTVENGNFANFSRNLLTLQANVNSVPAKLANFKEDLVCNQTPLNNRFMNVFRKNLNVSLAGNPLGPVAKLIPPRG